MSASNIVSFTIAAGTALILGVSYMRSPDPEGCGMNTKGDILLYYPDNMMRNVGQNSGWDMDRAFCKREGQPFGTLEFLPILR